MIYKLTEWNGNGSGEVTITTNNKKEAMAARTCKLTYRAALKKYGKDYFMATDVKCSTIDVYTSEQAMKDGIVKKTLNWY